MRVWRAGEGPSVVVLPGLTEAAQVAADRVAADLPGQCVTALEWPGIGGSAGLAARDLSELATLVGVAVDALGLSDAPGIAFDLAAPVARALASKGQAWFLIQETRARAWANRGFAPGDLTPCGDGTHLTALWAHLRNSGLLDPADPVRPDFAGGPLATPEELDLAVVSASADGPAYARLWNILAGAVVEQDGDLALARKAILVEAVAAIRALPNRLAAKPLPPTAPLPSGIWCDHADIANARLHVRHCGTAERPLMVLQSAPGSTAPLAEVIEGLSRIRHVVAPDFPGNGDSSKPDGAVDIASLARSMLAAADALGLDTLDLWGTHTGAVVALEMALIAPERIGRMVMEAPPILPAAFTADILDNYLPPIRPDRWGLHLQQAWNMRRDMFLFWPWYNHQRAALRPLGLPDAKFLHDWTLGLLKSGRTYDRSYRAAFEYRTAERLPHLTVPALITAGPADMLAEGLAKLRDIAPPCVDVASTPATVWYPNQPAEARAETIAIYTRFLDRDGSMPVRR
jgi:pimeloyl-ACP methyl ester carboxylesterase